MDTNLKGLLIGGIINVLNDAIRADNELLCKANLHIDQKPLHGSDMFFKLASIDDCELDRIAKGCGL